AHAVAQDRLEGEPRRQYPLPCLAICGAAPTWPPATAWAEGAQLNGRPSPRWGEVPKPRGSQKIRGEVERRTIPSKHLRSTRWTPHSALPGVWLHPRATARFAESCRRCP